MVDMYLFETNTLLDQLDEILLRTEQANTFTDDDINEIFRIMHTVKGSSAMMGFENLQKLAHKGEDMFFIIREDPSKMEDIGFVYDLVFQMSDLFKAEIEQIQNDENYEPTDFSEMIDKLEKGALMLQGELDSAVAEEKAEKEQAAEEKKQEDAAVANSENGYTTVRVFFQSDCKMENLRAFLLLTTIKEQTDVKSWYPEDVETNSETCSYIQDKGFTITFKADDDEHIFKEIENALNVESYEVISDGAQQEHTEAEPQKSEIKLESDSNTKSAAPINAPKPAANNAAPAPQKKAAEKTPLNTGSGKQSLISVNLVKLDQLHDIVGEIITTESMVIANPEIDGLQLESFSKAARDLRKLTTELQDTVMSIRMVPLTGPFQKMNRIVRDMKVKLKKDVELKIEGDTTEVDKSIVDNLNDPLMHLVRNCMDHGIEDNVEDRIAKGKPAKGTIRLAAVNSSGEVIITVADDGAGINVEKVAAKAEASGMLTKPISEYTDREIQNMILLPGFSTNDEVTEYSGRGVGMDVVRKNIEKVGGTLTLESKEGFGTTFIIKIPLTLAIIDGMEIKVGDTIFTVPISTIKQSFKVTNDQIIRDTQQQEMIMIRGVCYPIMRLHQKFMIPTEVTEFEDGILILVETDNKSICIFADRLIGELQVVVKPFPEYLSQYNIKGEGLSGCTIMGDGSISLIVDVSSLITSY